MTDKAVHYLQNKHNSQQTKSLLKTKVRNHSLQKDLDLIVTKKRINVKRKHKTNVKLPVNMNKKFRFFKRMKNSDNKRIGHLKSLHRNDPFLPIMSIDTSINLDNQRLSFVQNNIEKQSI